MSSTNLGFRPTRRDILLVLLTLSTSYLLFTPRPDPSASPLSSIPPITSSSSPALSLTAPAKPKTYIPDWLWPTSGPSTSCPTGTGVREETFDESIRTYGSTHFSGRIPAEDRIEGFDQGNEDFGIAHPSGEGNVKGTEGELRDIKTELLGHQAGWTLADRLYVFNGSFYVVT